MADVDDEESSGDEDSSSSAVDEGHIAGGEDSKAQSKLEEELSKMDNQGIPEEWEPFIDMPQNPIPPMEVPKFDLFSDNWGGFKVDEGPDPIWPCVSVLILGIFLLWYAYLREDSLIY